MNARAEITDRERLSEAAAHALANATDQEAAVELLLVEIEKDAALREALLAPWERQAAQHLVGSMIRSERAAVWHRPAAPDSRAHVLANAVRRSLMDFRLPGGKRLRDATAEDVMEAASFYARQSQDMASKSRWLSRVGRAMPKGKRVGDALDEPKLEKLRAEAEK